MRIVAALLAVCFGLGACEASGSPTGAHDGGKGRGDEPPHILERASQAAYDCQVGRELTAFAVPWHGFSSLDLLGTRAQTAYVLHTESSDAPPGPTVPGSVVLSRSDAQGALSRAHAFAVNELRLVSELALLELDTGGFAALWVERGGTISMPPETGATVRFAAFDGAGGVLTAAKNALTASPRFGVGALRAVALPGGRSALSWAESNGMGSASFLAILDAQGEVLVPPRMFAANTLTAAALVASENGLTALWAAKSTAAEPELQLLTFDEQGRAGAAVQRIAAPGLLTYSGFAQNELTALQTRSGLLIAWVEGSSGDGTRGGYSTIRIARLDGAGALVTSALLRGSQRDVDDIEPLLLAYGDEVAVLWGSGAHIYGCAGCGPDHDLELVLLAPETLTPRSNVVAIENTLWFTHRGGPGGLLNKNAMVLGETLLTAVNVTYHIAREPAFATFQCARR
jgi:hypothetical protein